MYGLVNEAIKGMVLASFDEETWSQIAKEAGVDEDFISMAAYDDSQTYALVEVASKRLDMPAEEILEAFGKHWIQFTAAEGYGPLVNLLGDSLETFLISLGDDLHGRIASTMPHLRPPDFTATQLSETHFRIGYRSHRQGLVPMVKGLLQGLADKYKREVSIKRVSMSEETGVTTAEYDVVILDRGST